VFPEFESLEILVAFCEDEVFVVGEGGDGLDGVGGLLPRVVVNCERLGVL
jgi:hypothetical protein